MSENLSSEIKRLVREHLENTVDDHDQSEHDPTIGSSGSSDGRRALAGRRRQQRAAGSPTPINKGSSDLLNRVVESGGFTYQPIDDLSPTEGFAVSTNPELERVFDASDLTEDDIFNYLMENAEVFDDPNMFAGGWLDTEADKFYLDVSHITQDRDEAIRLANENNQEGIYDLAAGDTVIVKDEADRRIDRPSQEDSSQAVTSSNNDPTQIPRTHRFYDVTLEVDGVSQTATVVERRDGRGEQQAILSARRELGIPANTPARIRIDLGDVGLA